ncbi:MAG: alpha/beta fold hydrolase [SAR202 cluster bacterium]|nr:alpha/beta fold hydrolase [SAR202 cluster bacterium]
MRYVEHKGNALKYIAIEPNGYKGGEAYPMVVFLHGFGSHMGDVARLTTRIDTYGYIYVCPNAPIAMNLGGTTGYAWAPLGGEGAREAQEHAELLLRRFFEEAFGEYGVNPGQAVIVGFSQGGVMALRTGLTSPETFRGVAMLSSLVPDPDYLRTRLPGHKSQSVFVAHGVADTLIPVIEAHRSVEFLSREGYEPTYKEYLMEHEVNPAVASDLADWMHKVLPPGGHVRKSAVAPTRRGR